ncbi:MAG TPA: TetR/AcrR family transcriptional regulator [Terricaulis sp.]|nr:TetR/AcrR family transcriptional regulator [Terricaulis sp.]HRP12174.1 TetR/AcrR family transcriptional regulator [Terricaulis sp.]
MDEKSATRDRILQAAIARIKHYGYGKTTMAEIAADCDMSPGNIYRFFEAKIDIAEAMARKHYAEEQGELAAIARKKDLPADKRLREIFFKRLRESYCMLEESAKIMEIAEVLHRERPLFANEQFALERVFLVAVLEDGEKAGLFAPGDHAFTAEMLQAATMKFSIPQLFSQLTLPKLERELEGVLNLIFNGLYARSEAGAAEPARARDAAET